MGEERITILPDIIDFQHAIRYNERRVVGTIVLNIFVFFRTPPCNMDDLSKQISYEILDPVKEEGRELTYDREAAQTAFDRGYLVSEHEIIVAYLSSGQKLTSIMTTEWRDQ